MSVEYTEQELSIFEGLVNMVSSPDQLERIAGRMQMGDFVKNHGNEKCDAMFAVLQEKWRNEDED